MIEPLSYFSFHHDWINKYRGMYYPVYGVDKRSLTANRIVSHVVAEVGFFSRYPKGPL